MFEAYFGMTKTPFSRNLPASELYDSQSMLEIISRLNYAAERQLFAVVTGECGTGKTTTIRKLRDTLDPAKYEIMYLADSKLTPRHFYKGLLEQLGCEAKFYRGDAKRQLHKEVELMQLIHHKAANPARINFALGGHAQLMHHCAHCRLNFFFRYRPLLQRTVEPHP